jgi:tetratricopeptide (TPR) repeat protein
MANPPAWVQWLMLRATPRNWGLLTTAICLMLIGFLPLFGGPGYEYALACGAVVPTMAALSTSAEFLDAHMPPMTVVLRAVENALWLMAISLVIGMFHGIRLGFCDLFDGIGYLLLGPFPGCMLGSLWGCAVPEIMRISKQKRWRFVKVLLLCGALPALSIFVSLIRFYTTPMVFAFDPFFGYFSGTIYDTVIRGLPRLLTYRAGTLLTIVAILGLAGMIERHESGKLVIKKLTNRWLAGVTVSMGVLSLFHTSMGAKMGHWQTTHTIQARLGRRLQSKRCVVIYSATIQESVATLFAKNCDEQVTLVEKYFEIKDFPTITAYLFRDADEKQRWMGAGHTYIAKPWRKEVYIQVQAYPHPVLGHELAHVISGAFARGPFRIGGSLFGIWPNPGLIEGIAVAASPDDEELSPEAWAKAMHELKLLPHLSSIFSLGFLNHSSSLSYTVAGAFVRWVHSTYGTVILRQWYGGQSLPKLTGKSFAQLESDFHNHVKTLTIPENSLAIAKARFDRPAVFGRKCPHEVDKRKQVARHKLFAGDYLGATQDYDWVLHHSPHDASSILARARCSQRQGDLPLARKQLEELILSPKMPAVVHLHAEEQLADLDMVEGKLSQAKEHYLHVQKSVLNEDWLRTLDVKLAGVQSEQALPAIQALLVGEKGHGPDFRRASEELGRWAEKQPTEPLPLYLLARQEYNQGNFDRSSQLLHQALELPMPLLRVHRETARLLVFAACASNNEPGVKHGLDAWKKANKTKDLREQQLLEIASLCGQFPRPKQTEIIAH